MTLLALISLLGGRSPPEARRAKGGGVDRHRTGNLYIANVVLCQLSYDPIDPLYVLNRRKTLRQGEAPVIRAQPKKKIVFKHQSHLSLIFLCLTPRILAHLSTSVKRPKIRAPLALITSLLLFPMMGYGSVSPH